MYEASFRFHERPFSAVPLASRYFPAQVIEQAHQSLFRAIDRADGAGSIVGPSGTGKTLLLQVLAEDFRNRFRCVLVTGGRIATARALLQAILFELKLPYRHMDESELRLSLIEHVSQPAFSNEGMLLLVDEAHSMSVRLLDELRMITNLVRDGQPRVRVVLAGNPKLEERFASPRLDSFAQRLAVRCYLEALGRDETAAYVRAQIKAVGGEPTRVLDDGACEAVYRATDGIPRLINQVCDHALMLAHVAGRTSLDAAIVEEAWSDLQQLPAPWNARESASTVGTQVIEFGGLEDGSDDLPQAIPFPVGAGTDSSAEPATIEIGAAAAERQLDRLQAHISELEDDFQPAGAIKPEVELVFKGGNHPFGDQFVEEEVVLDRYASLEANVFRDRPPVTSQEGRELGSLLAAHTKATSEPMVALKEAPVKLTREVMSDMPDEDEDADLIIIEDDGPAITRPVPPPLVRKQEYGQLFAKLRRG